MITLLNREKEEDPLRKSLVVSQFSSFLDLLEKPLQQSGFHFVRLDGSMTLRRRADVINMFSQTAVDSPTIMLLSLKAGGVGINLTAATRIFLMDPVSRTCFFFKYSKIEFENLAGAMWAIYLLLDCTSLCSYFSRL